MGQILLFDTTLRDGLKSPGIIFTLDERMRVAKQMACLQVDVLETGFPAASQEEYAAVAKIAREIRGPILAVLARATNPRDFEIARQALGDAEQTRVHTFVPVSKAYREHFLQKDAAQARALGVAAVKMAREWTADVEFSLVDAFRADPAETAAMVEAVVEAGATTINLADTVGYATPADVRELFGRLQEQVKLPEQCRYSIHCHNDLGLALANSLAAVESGVTQIHCTVGGIGERAGNTALEELVAVLHTRSDQYRHQLQIQLDQIYPTSRLVRRFAGVALDPHRPLVGANAFVVEPVVPQLADSTEQPPYEIMKPAQFGMRTTARQLSAATTLEEFRSYVTQLGYDLSEEQLQECYQAFQDLTQKKEVVFDADVELLVDLKTGTEQLRYKLLYLNVTAGSISVPNATVQLEVDGETIQDAGFGHGPVEAAFKTICKMVKRFPRLVRYEVNAVTPGTDAQGEVSLRLDENGHLVNGRAVDTDVVLASAKALIDGLNRLDRIEAEPVISEYTDEESWMPRL